LSNCTRIEFDPDNATWSKFTAGESESQPGLSFDFIARLRDYAWRKQRARIKTNNVIIATTLNTIRYSMWLARLFGWWWNRKLRLRLNLAFIAGWAGMAPAIAIAARDRYSLAQDHFSTRDVLQHQLSWSGFVV